MCLVALTVLTSSWPFYLCSNAAYVDSGDTFYSVTLILYLHWSLTDKCDFSLTGCKSVENTQSWQKASCVLQSWTSSYSATSLVSFPHFFNWHWIKFFCMSFQHQSFFQYYHSPRLSLKWLKGAGYILPAKKLIPGREYLGALISWHEKCGCVSLTCSAFLKYMLQEHQQSPHRLLNIAG